MRRTALIAAGLALFPAAPGLAEGVTRADHDSFDLARAIAESPEHGILNVPAGIYPGPITIDRPLTLVADGAAILDGAGDGDVVQILAADVTLRGFTIRGTGDSLDRENAGITVLAPRATLEDNTLEDVLFGIYLKDAPGSVIRGNRIGGKTLDVARRGDGIRLWYSPDAVIESNVVHDSRDVVMWFSAGVTLRGNTVTDGRYGLHFMYSDGNVLEDNRLMRNSVGAFLMYSRDLVLRRNFFVRNRGPSGYGVGLKDMDGLEAEDNLFVGNRVGVYLDNSPASVDRFGSFQRNVIAYNDIGIALQPAVKRNQFRENTFMENLQQVAVLGRGTFSGNAFTVDGVGNFWSNYRGYDLDGDGVGDLPFRDESLFENLMEREPKLRMFLFSPAQQAVDLASHAFPIMQPEPRFEDTAPRMSPTALRLDVPVQRSPGRAALLAVILLGAAALVALAGSGFRIARPLRPSGRGVRP